MVNALQIVLSVLVALLMLALGSTLSVQALKTTLRTSKRAVGVGLLSQFVSMPLLSFLLALALGASDVLGLSMVVVACSPGGSTSNLFTYYSGGDVGLSIAMTATSTLLALGLMPLNIWIYGRQFTSDDIDVDYVTMVVSLLLVLVPVAAGMAVRARSERAAVVVERVGSGLGVAFIVGALVFGSVGNSHIFSAGWRTWVAAVVMLLYGAGSGYAAARGVRVSPKAARTVALETGIQNSTLSLAVITLSFPDDTPAQEDVLDDLLVFPLLYSVFLVVDAAALTFLFRLRPVVADGDGAADLLPHAQPADSPLPAATPPTATPAPPQTTSGGTPHPPPPQAEASGSHAPPSPAVNGTDAVAVDGIELTDVGGNHTHAATVV